MGRSYVDYRGSGFWTRDVQAEVYLCLLSAAAGEVAGPPRWLRGAREDWRLQATAGFMGCVSPGLDEHVGVEPERVDLVLELSERVRNRLVAWGPAIPKDLVSALGTGGGQDVFDDDLDTGPFLRFADAFAGLLRGEFPVGPGTTTVY
ncbi:hypothetical protein ACIQWR_26285 [Streptomyces sp. NPDC098789]|uniref:hypothetical protein n=1 Tax=Streptomyces sp. NPDC098789 TaxID=3366098 RepID=UPI00381E5636